MKLYQFPTQATPAFGSTLMDEIFDKTRCDLEESGIDDSMISRVIGNLERRIEGQRLGPVLDEKRVDLLLHFLREFPCFSDYPLPMHIEQIYDEYMRDQLNDEQDVALEILLELLSPDQFEANFSECFHLLSFSDQQAISRVLSQYSSLIKNKIGVCES